MLAHRRVEGWKCGRPGEQQMAVSAEAGGRSHSRRNTQTVAKDWPDVVYRSKHIVGTAYLQHISPETSSSMFLDLHISVSLQG